MSERVWLVLAPVTVEGGTIWRVECYVTDPESAADYAGYQCKTHETGGWVSPLVVEVASADVENVLARINSH